MKTKNLVSILLTLTMAVSLLIIPAVVSADSYSTNMGKACWSTLLNITETPPGWNPLDVDVSYADGKATFVITPPVAFSPEAPNDNFWLIFDTDSNGVEDFQVLYNTRLPSEDPSQTYNFHWAKKTYNGGWGAYQEVPGDWDASETGLSEFTVSIPVSYLGGANSSYGFQIGLVKYVHMDNWDGSWPTIPWNPPTCGPWSTLALIFVPLPSEGWESEAIPANTSVGLTAETVEITAISVTPTDINFGIVGPGESVSGDDITVTNIGMGDIDVDANLDVDGTVFDYLQLNGAYSSGYSGDWPGIVKSLAPATDRAVTTGLKIPAGYTAQGSETAVLVFTAVAG